jgi:glycosyltransferase involved in cell wall biosynthesis
VSAPLVSTIIPVFNRAELLGEAVASVLAQRWRPIEILIVDNASTDDTPAAAAALAREHPREVRVLACATGGAGAAREVGRRAARGDYVQYLDSDDLLLPEKFARQVAALEEDPACGIAYGATRYRARDGRVLHEPWKRTGERIPTLFPSMLLGRWWGTSTPLYRRTLLEHGGPWLDLRNEEDWEYDCRLGVAGVALHHLPHCLSEERDHDGDRLSRAAGSDPEKLRDRARAHELILGHARNAGIGADSPEMQHFSRALFALARRCGAAGLGTESARLFRLARSAAGGRAGAPDFLAYGALARMVGWPAAGRLSATLDRFRRRR